MNLEKHSNIFADVKKPPQHWKNWREFNQKTKNNIYTCTQGIFGWHINIIALENGRFVFEWKFLIVWRRNFGIVANPELAIKKFKPIFINCHLLWGSWLLYHCQGTCHNATIIINERWTSLMCWCVTNLAKILPEKVSVWKLIEVYNWEAAENREMFPINFLIRMFKFLSKQTNL